VTAEVANQLRIFDTDSLEGVAVLERRAGVRQRLLGLAAVRRCHVTLEPALDQGLADGDLLDLARRHVTLELAVRHPVRTQVRRKDLLKQQHDP